MAVVTCAGKHDSEYVARLLAAGARIVNECPGKTYATPSRALEPDGDVHVARYEGAVLGTYEHNGYDDSDFYAVVWTGEAVIAVEYASTRGWTYHNGAVADATDEVKAAAADWLATRDVAAWKEATAIDACTVDKGKTVEVVKGRKVPIGTTGEVIWIGEDRYGSNRWVKKYRIGLKDAAGEVHWTAESNVKVVSPEQYLTSDEEIEATTRARVESLLATGKAWDWVSAYRSRGGALPRTQAHHRVEEAEALLAARA